MCSDGNTKVILSKCLLPRFLQPHTTTAYHLKITCMLTLLSAYYRQYTVQALRAKISEAEEPQDSISLRSHSLKTGYCLLILSQTAAHG